MGKILEVSDLTVEINKDNFIFQPLNRVSFFCMEGETLAIVGKSGSGKSMLIKSIMGLLPKSAKITSGQIHLAGKELAGAKDKDFLDIRGNYASMVFQDPLSSLNPSMTIGKQIGEPIRIHEKNVSRDEVKRRVLDLMTLVGIDNPEIRYNQYPYNFSGGMRQRAVIAMALSTSPKLLLCDEPTTALDVTVQAEILELLKEINQRQKTTIIIVTHDMGVVAKTADRVCVMNEGSFVEVNEVNEIFYNPQSEYTKQLISALDFTANIKEVPIV